MWIKLMGAAALFIVGCGLDTDGFGEDDADVSADAEADLAMPDETGPDSEAEDVSPPDAEDSSEADAPEETEPDAEAADEASPEDAGEDESSGEDGEADDGGTVDPCTRPDIPAAGAYMFFCFADDMRADMTLSLQAERGGLPIFPWTEIPDCATTDSRSVFCELPLYYNSVYVFNIQFSLTYPGTGAAWTCGPGADDVLWGVPRIWVNHVEQTVSTQPNTEGGCNHLFTTPPSGPP